jgi:hypothetical protein
VISPKAIAYQSPLWLFSNSIALFSWQDYLADGFGPIKWKTNCQTRVWLWLLWKLKT